MLQFNRRLADKPTVTIVIQNMLTMGESRDMSRIYTTVCICLLENVQLHHPRLEVNKVPGQGAAAGRGWCD